MYQKPNMTIIITFALKIFLLKKTASILLLSILLLQAGGLLVVFKMQQCYVWQEMQLSLKDNQTPFQKITLPFFDYQKSKINSHEISVNGKMYDVKSISLSDDKVELLVIHDSREENILQKIKDFAISTNQPNTDFANQLFQLLSLNYISPGVGPVFFIPSFSINIFSPLFLNVISNGFEIPSPPPKLG